MYECNTQEQLTGFYHVTMLNPVRSTVIKAAKAGYLQGWPAGFTEKAIKRHGLRSTKNREVDPMALPEQEQGIPIKSKKSEEYQKAYDDFYTELTAKGYKPTLHELDNEASRDVIEWIEKQQHANVELTQSDMH
eukprot:2407513-Ditylum_brightwellii.AAC.1